MSLSLSFCLYLSECLSLPTCLCLSVMVYLSLPICLFVSVSVSVSLSLSFCLYLSVFTYLSICHCLSVIVYLPVSISSYICLMSICRCLSASFSHSITMSLCLCLSISQSVCPSLSLSAGINPPSLPWTPWPGLTMHLALFLAFLRKPRSPSTQLLSSSAASCKSCSPRPFRPRMLSISCPSLESRRTSRLGLAVGWGGCATPATDLASLTLLPSFAIQS